MMRSLWTAATGMIAQQLNIDVISNNLANVNTIGFKKNRAEFEDLLYQNMRIAGTETVGGQRIPTGIQVGMGVRSTTVHKLFSQGDYQNTENPLDLAIEGDGFFRIDVNGEEAYTRAGAFKLNDEGTVVTANGHPLDPEFNVPEDTVNLVVTSDGTMSALGRGGEELATAEIPIYTFTNPAGLKAAGRNLYYPTEASGDAVQGTPGEEQFGTITQGYLEMSNVEIVDEMVNMIVGQRAYEINSKAIQTSDAMLQTATNLKR
ncbi:MAG: flagellar basal-body rod protein FlgG [Oceanidesulfovibrio sp.]